MKKKAYGYAHVLVQVEFDADPNRDEKEQALEQLTKQAAREYGLSSHQFEFSEGFEVYDLK